MQSIFIEALEIDTVIGVYDDERRAPQTLTFDIEIGLPSSRAFQSDSLADTIDYAAVAELIRSELASHSFILLERMVQHLCERIEMRFEVSQIRMRVAKGSIVPGARRVGVVLERNVPTAQALFSAHFSALKPLH